MTLHSSFPSVFLTLAAIAAFIPLSAHAAAPTCTLTANPSQVIPGQGLTLTLTIVGATSGTVSNGIGTMTSGVPRQSISLAQTTTYTATVSNADGTGTCSATATVSEFAAGGGSSGGGGSNPAQMLQGLGQTLQGLQGLLGGNNAQNIQCQPSIDAACGCGQSMTSKGCRNTGDKWGCPCQNMTNTFSTNGICQAGMCLGQTSGGGQGALGGGQGGLNLGALGQIMQGLGTLMGGGGGGGGGGGSGSYASYGCMSQYYYSTTPSADPCAIYQPGNSGLLTGTSSLQSGLASDLLDALGEQQNPVSGAITNTTNTGSSTGSQVSVSQTEVNVGSSTQLGDNLTGDVRLNPGATVFANLRQGLTEIAGFFGGNTFGSGSQSALSRLCASRPWAANNFLGSLAPDTFFDGLCRAAGYQVGQVQQGGGVGQQQTFTTTETVSQPAATTTMPYIPPEADIRAEPASVRLGTRTYIFWTAQGVDSCAVRGPNFEQFTLTGAGATVPITGPTTFTISCTAPDGTQVSDSVTVQLAI